jgi:hypothetical protein
MQYPNITAFLGRELTEPEKEIIWKEIGKHRKKVHTLAAEEATILLAFVLMSLDYHPTLISPSSSNILQEKRFGILLAAIPDAVDMMRIVAKETLWNLKLIKESEDKEENSEK